MIRVLNLSGNAYQVGKQHAEQVLDLRPRLLAAMQTRLAILRKEGGELQPYISQVTQAWQQHAPGTLEMLRGMAEALDLDREEYFTYTIASYLSSCLQKTLPTDGCTTWAANGLLTRDGNPILAKNRDYYPDHQPLQCLARVRPEQGHPYLCLTSAGSPGVFSSGINAAGLAIVDTHVPSTDLGPGIARYSLMMDILEKFSLVSEAEAYLQSCPHFGDGTVSLADAQGDLAVFEIAHSVQAIRKPSEDYVVSTNHFTAPETRPYWVDREPQHLQGNSQGRYRQVENALRAGRCQIDVPWSQALMARDGSPLSAICRGPEIDPHSMTISCVILLPQQAGLYVANGLPSQTPFEFFSVQPPAASE